MTTANTPRTRMVAGLAAIVAVGTIAVPSAVGAAAPAADGQPAVADDTEAERDGEQVRARLARACARIPNLQRRTDNLIERLQGDAETKGSLAWLQTQIERSEDAGRDQLVIVLENRLEVRTALLPVLELRRDGLDELAGLCAEWGADL